MIAAYAAQPGDSVSGVSSFHIGDCWFDLTSARLWVCTASGAPGTWAIADSPPPFATGLTAADLTAPGYEPDWETLDRWEARSLGDARAHRQTDAIDWDRLRQAAYRDCAVQPDPTALLDG